MISLANQPVAAAKFPTLGATLGPVLEGIGGRCPGGKLYYSVRCRWLVQADREDGKTKSRRVVVATPSGSWSMRYLFIIICYYL